MTNISSYNFQFFQNILTYTWISLFVKYPCATPPHHTHVQSLQFRTLLIDNDYSSAAKCRRADLSDRPGFRDFSRFLAALDELVPRRGLNRTAIRIVSSYLSLPIREKERERGGEISRSAGRLSEGISPILGVSAVGHPRSLPASARRPRAL